LRAFFFGSLSREEVHFGGVFGWPPFLPPPGGGRPRFFPPPLRVWKGEKGVFFSQKVKALFFLEVSTLCVFSLINFILFVKRGPFFPDCLFCGGRKTHLFGIARILLFPLGGEVFFLLGFAGSPLSFFFGKGPKAPGQTLFAPLDPAIAPFPFFLPRAVENQ